MLNLIDIKDTNIFLCAGEAAATSSICLDPRRRGNVQKAMEPLVYENLMSNLTQVRFL